MLTREMESWKNSCDKLSTSLSRKELEIQTLMKKLQDLEDETGHLKANSDTYKSQYEELVEVREEYLKYDNVYQILSLYSVIQSNFVA